MDNRAIGRRGFLGVALGSAVAVSWAGWVRAGQTSDRATIPVRAITRGPKFHWFAYYDKLQFDPTSRYALGMDVDFEHRSPTAEA